MIAPATSAIESMPEALDMEAAQRQFAILWIAYLGHWGPALKTPGRKQHHWRLHQLLDLMGETEGDREDNPEWAAFRDALPGFEPYWTCSCSYELHHQEL
jgi:hypothetical protein